MRLQLIVCKVLQREAGLMRRMVDGEWNQDEFLVVKPGRRISEDLTSEGIMKAD